MQPVLTPAEITDCERRTIAAGTPVEVLMERAGRAVAWGTRRLLGGVYGRRAVVVCGKGNNGGDGHIAARVLRGWGVRVEEFDLGDTLDERALHRAIDGADVLVDAMFGTGFRGTLDGVAAAVATRSHDVPTVAVDIPSGVDGDTGAVHGAAVSARATVTFAARKVGLCLEPGRTHAGRVEVADIGIDVTRDDEPFALGLLETADVRVALAATRRPPDTNKWKAGLLVIGGAGGMTGAAILVSHAAARAGAGIVWCGVPGRDAARSAAGSEAVVKELPAAPDGALTGLGEVAEALGRFQAVVLGPGLGTALATQATVRDLCAQITVPLVLDADGLNALAGDLGPLRARSAPTVLTPHDGEYARLLDEPVDEDRVGAARRLAEASGAVALLKGSVTVVAAPGGHAAINPTGGPALATAGSGDVLSGVIGGFLARGMDAFTAAGAGAFVHGLAAGRATPGLVAGDLVDSLPVVLGSLAS